MMPNPARNCSRHQAIRADGAAGIACEPDRPVRQDALPRRGERTSLSFWIWSRNTARLSGPRCSRRLRSVKLLSFMMGVLPGLTSVYRPTVEPCRAATTNNTAQQAPTFQREAFVRTLLACTSARRTLRS